MKISKDGVITYSDHDVFIRHLIVFSDKLLNEEANNWFGEYCKKISPDKPLTATDLEPKRKYICSHLKKKYNFEDNDFGVWLFQASSRGFGNVGNDRKNATYSIKDANHMGDRVAFDHYNGYWYTATETGTEQGLVLFDYGDFYCMGGIFPLATYFVMRTKEYEDTGK